MNITVFTSNQPRHLALVNRLASISEVTYAVMECNTVFPGLVPDVVKRSDVMRSYFAKVMNAEKGFFGELTFLSPNVRALPIKMGDVNFLQRPQLLAALASDVYVIFGASYIKGWLADFLVQQGAFNVHMGISPYYRGSACNFWALYDERPQYVGATIHLLSRGLDSGPILYHALPILENNGPFEFTMKAVEAAQKSLVERIASRELRSYVPISQDKDQELRYTRGADFTDETAANFLARDINADRLQQMMSKGTPPQLLHPFYA